MSDLNKIRLNKVIREFNISLERVVEFLSSKGHTIEARPTTKISTSQYDLLLSEFKSDRSSKVESHDLTEEKLKEKEELRIKFERDQEKNKNRIITSKSSIHKFKKIGEIDLDKKIPNQDLEIKNDVKTLNSNEDDNEKVLVKNESKIHTKYEKLSGLKKTGEKINLEKFNRSDSENDSAKNKRKRRRIAKDIINNKDSSKNTIDKQNKSRNVVITPSDDEVQKQIKETLEKLQTSKSKGAKYRKEKRDTHKKRSEDQEKTESEKKVIKVTEFITVGEVATMMDVSGNDIISACMSLGIMVTMNQRLDAETLSVVADEFGFEVDFVTAEIEESINVNSDLPEDLLPRPPIVTVMGHVDHGKTSLLDFIRKENVIAGESGGITQHIGAYSVKLKNDNKITFLDTPGHEAFTAMRARGTQLTDIVVIVIAADDDIMPQTKEAISHAQAAGVPIIFAINKIDRDVANPEKIKEKLSGMNLLVEEWGGKIQSHDISALKGIGVDELLEKILLESEMLELKANPNKAPSGSVIEARLDKGKGYISTLLVQTGTLNIGDYILAGQYSGKVKALYDERGHQIKSAGPSMPVSVLGLDGAPQAGDKFNVFVDEKEAKQIAAKRTQLVREQSVRTQKHITLDEIGRRIAIGDFKELNIILKGDVDGSVEALSDSFQKLSTDEIIVNIIHKAVGAITESDILLASASDAIVIGFNVRPSGNARSIADKEEVDIRNYSIIYDAINDLKDAMEGLLSPELKEEITGSAEIRETFKISKIGTIAGCMVMNGKINRKSKVRLIREGIVITTTELSSLKRFQDDVKDVSKGYDCGIQLKNYNDIKIGDVLECFNELKVKKKLKK
jgi:translation initiation factor IF-2